MREMCANRQAELGEVRGASSTLTGQWLPWRGQRAVPADFRKAFLVLDSLRLTPHPLRLLNPLGAPAVLPGFPASRA